MAKTREMRLCIECDEIRPYYAKGLCTRCYDRARPVRKRNNPQKDWESRMIRDFNISPQMYMSMLIDQRNGCAICGKSPEENGQRLAVDHDHTCCPGKKSCGDCIRGLLCSACNTAIGQFEDNTDRMMSAINYLKNN